MSKVKEMLINIFVRPIVFWILILIFILGVLSGCSITKPYAEIGIAHQVDAYTDWISRTDRDWQCSNPAAFIELGAEIGNGYKVSLLHQSWVTCGGYLFGSNDKPEMFANYIYLGKQWGGN